jgi:Flp pilus assembly protein TadB
MIVSYVLCALCLCFGSVLFFKTQRHSQDRFIADSVQAEVQEQTAGGTQPREADRKKGRMRAWVLGAFSVVVLQVILSGGRLSLHPMFMLGGSLIAEMWWQRRQQSAQRRYIRQIEFYLPTVMERVVMAVGAGFDILPALLEAARGSRDPVSQILKRAADFMNSGLGLEEALNAAVGKVECPALKHVCVHLSLAHRQGGELVRPLRELGDSTQAYYQETIEEEIAKLPVKAVVPLVLTFAGLIVCFLTVPIIQLGSLTSKVTYGPN